MPVVIPALLRAFALRLPAVAVMLGWLFVAYVAVELVRAIFTPLRHIPFGVGGWIYGQLNGLVSLVHNALIHHLNDHAKPLAQLFVQLGQELRVGWDATADFANELAIDFDYWTTVGLHTTIKAFTNAVLKVANEAHTLAKSAHADVIDLRGDVKSGLGLLRRYVETELFGRAMAGIDKLRSDVFNEAIPAVENEIGAAVGKVRGEVAGVAGDLKGLAGSIPFDDINKLIASVPLLAAAIGIIEAEAGLGRKECRDKVRGICTTDPDLWEGLLWGLVGGLAILDFEELVRLAEEVTSTFADDISRYIVEQVRMIEAA